MRHDKTLFWILGPALMLLLAAAPAAAQGTESDLQQQEDSTQTDPLDSQNAPVTDDAAAGEGGEELPQTASPIALLALLGLGATGAAGAVRLARRR